MSTWWEMGERGGISPHPEQLLWQVSSFVDASVHGDESFHRRFVSDVGVVQAGVQHDDGERQHVAGVCGPTGQVC